MSIQNPSFLLAASIAATGGTALPFVLSNQKIANGIGLIETVESDVRRARRISLKSRSSFYDKTKNIWTPSREEATVTLPVILADGTTSFESWTLVHNSVPEIPVATCDASRGLAAQVLFDTDLVSFWQRGSLI